jgi:hypothetical protein
MIARRTFIKGASMAAITATTSGIQADRLTLPRSIVCPPNS